jgi:cytochrome oxidase Cu insertion factor (SCO1/SenC/PrrC family)
MGINMKSHLVRFRVLAGQVVVIGLCLAGACRASGPAQATPPVAHGVPVGAQAPSFHLKDQHGNERSLGEFLKKGNVALVFFRSARW